MIIWVLSYQTLYLVKLNCDRLLMSLTSAHSLVFGWLMFSKTYKWSQGQWGFQCTDFIWGNDIINLSFFGCKRYQEKALEFSFHLRRCTAAKVQVRRSYVRVGEAYPKVVSGPKTIPSILLKFIGTCVLLKLLHKLPPTIIGFLLLYGKDLFHNILILIDPLCKLNTMIFRNQGVTLVS